MGERRGTKGLELWCRKMTEGYAGVKIDNMTTSWRNGLAFCALIHHFRPELIEFDKLDKADIYGNNELAFRVAEHHLGIPALLDPEDMVEYEVPDRLSILTYLSQFYQTFESQRDKSEARLTPKRPTTAPELAPSTSPPTAVRITVGRARREPCARCDFPVFLAERLSVGKRVFHRACFRCARCTAPLSLANYYETESGDYCCEVCPDEVKSSVASSSLSDEQKSSLAAPDAYSAHCDDALEQPQDEELRRSSTLTPTAAARSLFFISQMQAEEAPPEPAGGVRALASLFEPPRKAHVVALDDLEDFDSVVKTPNQCDTSLVTDECLVALQDKAGPEEPETSQEEQVEELQGSGKAPRSKTESTEELQDSEKASKSETEHAEELQDSEPAPRSAAEPTGELQNSEKASKSETEHTEELQDSEKAPGTKTEQAEEPISSLEEPPDYPEDLNPFGDDDAYDFRPVPAARTKKKGGSAPHGEVRSPPAPSNPFEDEETDAPNEPDASRPEPRAGSDGGSTSSLSSRDTIRKKKPAPPPPPTGTMRSRKTKRAPLPPTVSPRRIIAAPAFTPDVDEDKSAAGRWKRLKAPSPVRPVPPKRSVPPLPIPEIRRELDTIEIQQRGLENQGVRLEQIIRDRCEGGEPDDRAPPDVEDLILQLFELVNEKNELFRRQAELMYLRRQQRLEEEQADVEHQIRCLMSHPDATKTDYDKVMEEALIGRLVEIVERRNQIIDCLESDRRRNIDEDTTISSQLSLYNAQREALEPKKKKKHKKLAKMLEPFRHKKDKH